MFGVSFVIIHVSDQPVAPSLAFVASTLPPSACARLTMTCQDVPTAVVPELKAWIALV